ncbi:D-amino-acid transaminase [Aureimonas mangrovi]|uniref:D-amino-acid transaminase n=1 Tax=Aureimonas mangrovi TaxID=2758041 RepID=UPI00163D5830|nr:D-amino-acid transaminase [Aureimonas mangrovi]
MSRTVYVNGEYLPEEDAKISVFDRAFLFADGVYEVTAVVGGKLLEFSGHMARLRRSLGELGINEPASEDELLAIHREMVARNGLDEGLIYLQVTRGSADRDFAFPPADTVPSLVLFTQAGPVIDKPTAAKGLRVALLPDMRWGRRDIKTVQLLYPSIAKMEAKKLGKDDAWLVEDGKITEGTSNNAYIVLEDGRVVTRPLSHAILPGITRASLMRVAAEHGVTIEERPFTVEEARSAREAFITSASSFATPVVEIDGVAIGDGRPGPLSMRLREIYIEESLRNAI